MAEPFISEIRSFAFEFAPRNWARCDGQLMPVSQNKTLASLLGARFGGDGVKTFGLPNLQGRVAVGAGQGPGLTPRTLGERGGAESVALMQDEIPTHSHELKAGAGRRGSETPSGTAVLNLSTKGQAYSTAEPTTPLSDASISTVEGDDQPHENRMPYLTVNFCIALQGEPPKRP